MSLLCLTMPVWLQILSLFYTWPHKSDTPSKVSLSSNLLINRIIRKVLPSLEVKLVFKPISFVKKQVKKKKSCAVNIFKTKVGTELFFASKSCLKNLDPTFEVKEILHWHFVRMEGGQVVFIMKSIVPHELSKDMGLF